MNYEKFIQQTGLITSEKKLKKLNLIPDGALGSFDRKKATLLIDFCERNPDYHIITQIKTPEESNDLIYHNKMTIENSLCFFLGKGDKKETMLFCDIGTI